MQRASQILGQISAAPRRSKNTEPLLDPEQLACAAWAYAVPASANPNDLFNEFDLPVLDPATSTYGPNGIEIDFQGNVCPNIPAQYVQDQGIDPFIGQHRRTSSLAEERPPDRRPRSGEHGRLQEATSART